MMTNEKEDRFNEKNRLQAVCEEAARYYQSMLYTPNGAAALEYVQKRGLREEILNKFSIGFAPDSLSSLLSTMQKKGYTGQELKDAGLAVEKDGQLCDRFRGRLMFPIMDIRGNVIGFCGQTIDNSAPKYLLSPETSIFNKRDHLFSLNLARKGKEDTLILVEGYWDVIALHQHGFDNAVAPTSISLTEEQAALLAKHAKRVFIIYDGDDAGDQATFRDIPILEKAGLEVRLLRIKEEKDPVEFIRKYGAEEFGNLMDKLTF